MEEIKLLIVEDEGIIAQDLQHKLEQLGYIVPAIAHSGKAALKKTAEIQPDLVLMDIVLKGKMDGIETAEQIRTCFDIPVIFVTAYADDKTLKRARVTEPFGYILKPFSSRELHTNIQMALYKHQMERKLRENEKRYRTLFETMAQGVVYQDASGQIISANPAAENILGLTLDQMQGRTSLDPRWRAIHEGGSDFPGETHPAMVALKTGQPVKDVVMGVFHPGRKQYRWININAIPLFKPGETKPFQVYTTFNDITDRKRVEESLRTENSFRQAIITRAAEGLCVCHEVSEYPFVAFTIWNDRMTEITGYKMEEINRLGWYQMMYPDPQVQEQARERMARMRYGDDLFFEEWVVTRADGEKRTLLISTSLVESSDGQAQVLAMMHDITERKQVEEMLREQRNLLKTIFAATPDLFVLKDRDSVYRVVNSAFWGYNPNM